MEKELNELPDNSTNIFKKSNTDQYIDRPNALFNGENYTALDYFCCTQFSAYCNINNKPDHSSEHQLDELQDKLNEKNYEECSYQNQVKVIFSCSTH